LSVAALRQGLVVPKFGIAICWSQEDQSFIGEVPELPGCAADGKTYQEALANAKVVIREWIETAKELSHPIPAPKGRLVLADLLGRADESALVTARERRSRQD
jgi:predicted RNase H-like HicB family nuclease